MFNLFKKRNTPKHIPKGFNTDFDRFAKKYADPDGNNMILSKNLQMNLDSTKILRNNNVFAVGVAGSGKSRLIVKPNLLQANCSYVVVDAAGCHHKDMTEFFKNQGYDVKILDLQNPTKSHHYNPFDYIDDEKDVRDMVECIMVNSGYVPFVRHELDSELATAFRDQVRAFWTVLIAWVANLKNKEDRTFATIHKIFSGEGVDSKVEAIIDECKTAPELSFVHQDCEDLRGRETIRRMMIEVALHIQFLLMPAFKEMTRCDEMDLRSFGKKKTICFIIMPLAHECSFLAPLLCMQLQNVMEKESRKCNNGKLPIHVMCALDEFGNFGYIPNLNDRLATCRPINMNYLICAQSIAQAKAMYRDKWMEVIANCDTYIRLPSGEYTTNEYTHHKTGDLISVDELRKMQWGECVVCVSGEKPFLDYTYDVEKHENYKHTMDAKQ